MTESSNPQTWTTADLWHEPRRYEVQLRAAGLKENTVRTYVDRASTFLRWIAGDYTPQGPVS